MTGEKIFLPSPKITALAWGQVNVEGFQRPFKDVKLFPGGAREWDWGATGTHHAPGILPGDLEELIDSGAETLVLSRGVLGRLHVSDSALEFLKKNQVQYRIMKTKEAVVLYNHLRLERPTGALIHSTC